MSKTDSTITELRVSNSYINKVSEPEQSSKGSWFTEFADHIGTGIIILDMLNETVIAMNKTAENYFRSTVKPKDFTALHNLFFNNSDKTQVNENWFSPRSKVLKYGSKSYGYTIHPLPGGFMGLFVQDITQKIRNQESEKAHQFKNLVDTVFEGITDVYHRPCEVMRSELEQLRDELAGETNKNHRKRIDKALSRLETIEQLNGAMTEFESFNNINFEVIDLCEYMHRFEALISRFLERKEIFLQTVFAEEQLNVAVDPDLLRRALFNIISNAADAVSEGLEPIITLGFYKNEERVHITIEDNGHGVPPLLEDNLLYPFYTSKLGAIGLGLTITHKILTVMHGKIDINSIYGVGTLVNIDLPLS